MTDLSLEITRAIPHPPEKVFDAWLDPAMLAKFMLPGPNMSVPEARSDAKVGGRFKIIMRAPEAGDLPHEGRIQGDRSAQSAAIHLELTLQSGRFHRDAGFHAHR